MIAEAGRHAGRERVVLLTQDLELDLIRDPFSLNVCRETDVLSRVLPVNGRQRQAPVAERDHMIFGHGMAVHLPRNLASNWVRLYVTDESDVCSFRWIRV